MTQQGCSQESLYQHGRPQFLQGITHIGCRVHAQRQLAGLNGTPQRLELTAHVSFDVRREKKSREKTAPFGVNLMRSQVLDQAAQVI